MGCIRSRNSKVTCCHFSSDGKLLASSGHDRKVKCHKDYTPCLRKISQQGEHDGWWILLPVILFPFGFTWYIHCFYLLPPPPPNQTCELAWSAVASYFWFSSFSRTRSGIEFKLDYSHPYLRWFWLAPLRYRLSFGTWIHCKQRALLKTINQLSQMFALGRIHLSWQQLQLINLYDFGTQPM